MNSVIVAFASQEARQRIVRMLESGGWRVAGCFCTGAEVLRTARKLGGALVVCGFKLRDTTADFLAQDLRGSGAVLVVSSPANLSFCQGENLFKLATPAARSDFFATLELMGRSVPARPPRRKLEDQRLIDRAKSLLMDVNRMTEGEAHRFLQKRSMDTGTRLLDTAQWVLDTYQL